MSVPNITEVIPTFQQTTQSLKINKIKAEVRFPDLTLRWGAKFMSKDMGMLLQQIRAEIYAETELMCSFQRYASA